MCAGKLCTQSMYVCMGGVLGDTVGTPVSLTPSMCVHMHTHVTRAGVPLGQFLANACSGQRGCPHGSNS